MTRLRILYFRGSLLEGSEDIETNDVVGAMQWASAQRHNLTAEVWSDEGRIAVVRPTRTKTEH